MKKVHSILIHLSDGIHGYGAIKPEDFDTLMNYDKCCRFNIIMSTENSMSDRISEVNNYLHYMELSDFVIFSTENIDYFIKQLETGYKDIRGWSCTKL